MAKLNNLIAERLKEIGQEPADLRRELARAGARVSRQSVHAWLTGKARPSQSHLIAIIDVMLIPLERQRLWHEAAAAWSPPPKDPAPQEEVTGGVV
jgi:hypothetical protein